MFTIDDFMLRHRDSLAKINSHRSAPPNGFDDIPVQVTRREFHEICTQDPRAFTTKKVHGLTVLVV
jgi:hypothetical protein